MSFAGGRYRLEYPIGKVLYEPPGWITYARVSPNGERIAFLDHPRLGDIGGSVTVIDRAGKKVTLSSGWKALQGLAWSGTDDEVWFTGSRSGKGGSSALYAVTLAGRERLVFSSPGTLKLHDISPDGQRVLLTRGTTRGGVVSLGPDGAKERELSWFDYSTVADLSSGWKDAVVLRVGRRRRRASQRFSFEGRTAAMRFVWAKAGRSRYRLMASGRLPSRTKRPHRWRCCRLRTGEVRPMPRGPIAEYLDWAVWSPDGRRIYFAGRDASDVRRTYVQDVDGGEPRPVTPDGIRRTAALA